MSISGLHDLRPLLLTGMNDVLSLDATVAARESPALLRPATAARITAWVGGGELPAFLQQTRMLAEAWSGQGAHVAAIADRQHNHFPVLEDLCIPGSGICQHLFG